MKVSIVYGIFAGLLYCLYFFLDYKLGYQTEKFDIGVLTSITIFIIPMIATYLGTKASLNRQSKPGFMDGFKAAVTIVLISGIIASLYAYWHINHFTPDYVEMAKSFIQARGEAQGASQEDITRFLSITENRFSLNRRILTCVIGFVAAGIPAGLFGTWMYLRRNR